jgi:hypothetical protein
VPHEVFVQQDLAALLVLVDLGVQPRFALRLLVLLQLAQEDDVGGDFGAGVLGEGVVGQADRAQQLGLAGDVVAGAVAGRVHEEVGHHHRQHAVVAEHVDALGEEEVVDGEAADLLARAVVHAHRAERRVADRQVEPAVGRL